MKASPYVLGVFLLGILHLGAQPFGLSNRVANTTLRMPSSLSASYRSTNAFGSTTFTTPVAIVTPPGETNRVFIVEQIGRIAVITNLANPNRTVFADLTDRVRFGGEQGLLGLAFHPGYATNRLFFVSYIYPPGATTRYGRLSRFEASATNPNTNGPGPEVVLIQQVDDASNHNAGDLHFGADGYLYMSLGDEGNGDDSLNNSQTITKDFYSGIIRIDVDKRPENLAPNPHPANTNNPTMTFNYSVPADNPFVGATSFNGLPVNPANVRTEFWAVGLRNPWRISFDRVTGYLWCGDVGQNLYEEVDIIVRGGNYGWAYREGLNPGPKPAPGGFIHINPIQEYRTGTATNQGDSITGGVVYRGNALPDLYGAYLFADYESDNLWQMRYEINNGVTNITPYSFMFKEADIAAFGVDPRNGDVLMANVVQGTIKRLIGDLPPPTLADVGAFSDLANLTPQPGILPYDVNTPVWADGAEISRWFSVPSVAGRITFRPTNAWSFPVGTVWLQHFEIEMTNGAPGSRRRLETRVLVRDTAAANSAYGVTYRWTSPTNAVIVPNAGLEELLTINLGGGLTRTQAWKYPSRADCMVCHNVLSGRALGFNTPQLNRNHDYDGIVDNQLRALNNVSYFTASISNLHSLPRLADLADTSYSAEYRARSYLMANCAHCHYPNGPGLGSFDARIYRALSSVGIVDGALLDNLGNPSNRVISPGSIANSVMHQRMASETPGFRMPFMGSVVPDTQALAVFGDWIANELQGFQTFADWQLVHFGGTNAPNGGAQADFDGDGAKNLLEYLTETDPTDPADAWGIGIERSGNNVNVVIPQVANRGFEVQWSTNLMSTSVWRFLNVPENCPQFSTSNRTHRVPDAVGADPKFYRVRVYEH